MNFISRFLNSKDPVIIMPFGGYASEEKIVFRARVLEDEGIETKEDDGRLKNIWNSFKRFESDEKAGVIVLVRADGLKAELHSDEEGYVELEQEHDIRQREKKEQWLPVDLTLQMKGEPSFSTTTEVLIPSSNAQFGVISDVDDTILHTGVSSLLKWRLIVNSIAVGSSKRQSLAGSAALYRALHSGLAFEGTNPLFYVSNSPWNLHEYLQAFLREQNFPKGPLLLRDFGRKEKQTDHPFLEGAKYKHILNIISTYPNLPFVLIGDAAELDADIYLHVHHEFAGLVKAIIIREVNHREKVDRVRRLIDENDGAPIHLVKDFEEAKEKAAQLGLL